MKPTESFSFLSIDHWTEEFIQEIVNYCLQPDDYYQQFQTPLKTAQLIKEEHRQQLNLLLRQDNLKKDFHRAYQLISIHLSSLISALEFTQVIQELKHCGRSLLSQFEKFEMDASQTKKPVFLQQAYGISNTSLSHIYKLSHQFYHDSQYQDAYSLLIFLTALAPDILSYWIGAGLCLQGLKKHEEAVEMYRIGKMIKPQSPLASMRLASVYLHHLQKISEAKEETTEAIQLFHTNPDEYKTLKKELDYLKIRLSL